MKAFHKQRFIRFTSKIHTSSYLFMEEKTEDFFHGRVLPSLTQRKDFDQDKKTPEFEVSERVTVTINTFLRMHQAMGRVVAQLEEKGVIKKREQAN